MELPRARRCYESASPTVKGKIMWTAYLKNPTLVVEAGTCSFVRNTVALWKYFYCLIEIMAISISKHWLDCVAARSSCFWVQIEESWQWSEWRDVNLSAGGANKTSYVYQTKWILLTQRVFLELLPDKTVNQSCCKSRSNKPGYKWGTFKVKRR